MYGLLTIWPALQAVGMYDGLCLKSVLNCLDYKFDLHQCPHEQENTYKDREIPAPSLSLTSKLTWLLQSLSLGKEGLAISQRKQALEVMAADSAAAPQVEAMSPWMNSPGAVTAHCQGHGLFSQIPGFEPSPLTFSWVILSILLT